VPAGRGGTDTRGTHISHVRTGAGLLLGPGHQVGLAEHVENGGNAEGQRLRESAGNEVHVRVDQTGKHRPAARVDHFIASWAAEATEHVVIRPSANRTEVQSCDFVPSNTFAFTIVVAAPKASSPRDPKQPE
jgi:hypothetical protein